MGQMKNLWKMKNMDGWIGENKTKIEAVVKDISSIKTSDDCPAMQGKL